MIGMWIYPYIEELLLNLVNFQCTNSFLYSICTSAVQCLSSDFPIQSDACFLLSSVSQYKQGICQICSELHFKYQLLHNSSETVVSCIASCNILSPCISSLKHLRPTLVHTKGGPLQQVSANPWGAQTGWIGVEKVYMHKNTFLSLYLKIYYLCSIGTRALLDTCTFLCFFFLHINTYTHDHVLPEMCINLYVYYVLWIYMLFCIF